MNPFDDLDDEPARWPGYPWHRRGVVEVNVETGEKRPYFTSGGPVGPEPKSTAPSEQSDFFPNIASGMKATADFMVHAPGAAVDAMVQPFVRAAAALRPSIGPRPANPFDDLGSANDALPDVVKDTFASTRAEREHLSDNAAKRAAAGQSPAAAALGYAVPQTIGNLLDPTALLGAGEARGAAAVEKATVEGGESILARMARRAGEVDRPRILQHPPENIFGSEASLMQVGTHAESRAQDIALSLRAADASEPALQELQRKSLNIELPEALDVDGFREREGSNITRIIVEREGPGTPGLSTYETTNFDRRPVERHVYRDRKGNPVGIVDLSHSEGGPPQIEVLALHPDSGQAGGIALSRLSKTLSERGATLSPDATVTPEALSLLARARESGFASQLVERIAQNHPELLPPRQEFPSLAEIFGESDLPVNPFDEVPAQRAYRGVPAGANPLDTARASGGGLFFSPDRAVAETYAGHGGTVAEHDLRFTNPLEVANWMEAKKALGLPRSASMEELIGSAREAGHDGLAFTTKNGRELVALDPAAVLPPAAPTRPPNAIIALRDALANRGEQGSLDVGQLKGIFAAPDGVPGGAKPPKVPPYPMGGPGDMSTKGVTNVGDDAMKAELEQFAADHEDVLQRARRGVQPVDQYHDAEQLASDLGVTLPEFLKHPAGQVLGSREVALGRSLLGGLRNDVKEIADQIAAGSLVPGTEEHAAGVGKIASLRADMTRLMSTLQGHGASEWGRGLRSLQENVDPFGLAADPAEQLHLALTKKYAGQLDDDTLVKISQLGPDAASNGDLMNFLRTMEHPRFRDYLSSYWFGSVLSGTKTLLKNGIGNAVKLAEDTAMRPLTAIVDAPLSVLQGRSRAHVLREVIPATVGIFQGFPKGIERFAFVMKNGYEPSRLVAELIGEGSKFGAAGMLPADAFVLSQNPAVRKAGAVLNVAPRLLEATDALFRSMADSSERYAWATRKALEEKTGDVAGRVAELLAEQPDEMIEAARKAAAKATYTDPMSWVGKMATGLRRETGVVGQHLLPFVHVSDRVAASVTDFIPFSKPRKLAAMVTKGDPEAADLIARQAVGAALTLLGASWASQGKLVGGVPKDEKARNDFYADGKQPYSLLMGGRWVPYRDVLGPMAGPFVLASAYHEQLGDGGKPIGGNLSAAAGMSLASARFMLDASYLQTLQDVVQSVQEENGPGVGRGIVTAGARSLGGYVPFSGLQRNIATTMDPRVVDKDGFVDELKAGIPGLRQQLPSRVGSMGEELVTTTGAAGGMLPVVPTENHVADVNLQDEVTRARASLADLAQHANASQDRILSAHKLNDKKREEEMTREHPDAKLGPWARDQLSALNKIQERIRFLRGNKVIRPEARRKIEIQLQKKELDIARKSLMLMKRPPRQVSYVPEEESSAASNPFDDL